jgi:hypothetical protein
VIGEDRYFMAVQLVETVQRAERVEPVVQDCDLMPYAYSLAGWEPVPM